MLYKSETFELLELLDIVGIFLGIVVWMGPRGRFYPYLYHVIILDCLGQVSCRHCNWVELPVERRLYPIFRSGVG